MTTNFRCTVCQHPDREAIDAALLQGMSLRSLARQHGNLSKDALHRHVAHVDAALRAEVSEHADLTAASIASRLAEIADDARRARRMLQDAGRFREAARLSDVETRSLGVLADRLAVGDLSQIELAIEVKATQAAIRGVLSRRPEDAQHLVAELRAAGHDGLADNFAAASQKYIARRAAQPEEVSA